MPYVSTQNDIPNDDVEKIRTRVINQINSMSEAELRIIDKSQRDLRDFIADIFKSVAAALGYTIGTVVGTIEEILGGVATGLEAGFKAGYKNKSSGNPLLGFFIIAIVTFILILIFKWING